METGKSPSLLFCVICVALTDCVLTSISTSPSSAGRSETAVAIDRTEDQDCATVGPITYYCPGDEVCCLPGNPASNCCPAAKPLCFDNEYCCATEYPQLCGTLYCCTSDSYCCDGQGCCASEDQCCGPDQCCTEEAPCCTGPDSKTCCDEDTMACCGPEFGCGAPCEVQFDALGCQLPATDETVGVPWVCQTLAETSTLYRILRIDESCDVGILAKNPAATKTVRSHVNCGSKSGYKSQYISFTTSMEAANYYRAKFGSTNQIAQVNDIPQQCMVIDLNIEANRDYYLENAVCKNFAKASCEVVLSCGIVPVPCTVPTDSKGFLPTDVHAWL